MEIYEKSYRGLILWTILFPALVIAACFVPVESEQVTILSLNVANLGITALMAMIVRNESVYWINSVTFEQAKKASSEARRAFALAHLRRFAWFSAVFLLYSAAAWRLSLPWWPTVLVFALGLIAAGLSTVRIRLEEPGTRD